MALFDENLVCDTDLLLLRDLLPAHYFEPSGRRPANPAQKTDTLKFIEVFEEVFCQLTNDIKNLGLIIDVDVTDERFLDMIIRNLAFDLNVSLSLTKKRKLAKVITEAYKQKGTCVGIENTIRQFTGVDVTCFPFTAGWILDVSELAIDTYLNPAPDNPAGFYTFDVVVNQQLSAEQRRIILNLIELIKPAHSHFRSLVEEGEDTFVTAITIMMNRGTLYLWREQNTDGGWDTPETDGNNANASSIENVSHHGVGEYFGFLFVNLPRVDEAFQLAATKLINDATYVFSTLRPRENDILLLNRANLAGVVGAAAKRDQAIFSLKEFAKAMAFLNDFTPIAALLAGTTQPERDSTTLQKRSQFLYLYLTTAFGLGDGICRFARYIRDMIEIGDDPFAEAMTLELYSRTSVLNFETDLGQYKVGAAAAIALSLQQYNVGLIYESRIQDALAVLEGVWVPAEKVYKDTFTGSGRLFEQAFALDLHMARAQFDRAKTLMDGLRLLQRIDGSVDDPIDVGTAKLRDLGAVMDSVGRAIKRINDEGI